MKTVLFIRHGQSEAQVGLPTDAPGAARLTALGREQATLTASYLRSVWTFGPELLVASSYQRSIETADAIAGSWGRGSFSSHGDACAGVRHRGISFSRNDRGRTCRECRAVLERLRPHPRRRSWGRVVRGSSSSRGTCSAGASRPACGSHRRRLSRELHASASLHGAPER